MKHIRKKPKTVKPCSIPEDSYLKVISIFRQSNGFTIVELLIVIAIVGFLATLSVPSASNWILKEKQNSYTRELIAYISLIRREARRWNGTCTISPASVASEREGKSFNVTCKGMNNNSKMNIARQVPMVKKTVFQEVNSKSFSITPKGPQTSSSSEPILGSNLIVSFEQS